MIPVFMAFLLVAIFLLLVVFGPGNAGRLGFVSTKKEEQKSFAQQVPAPYPDRDYDGFLDNVEEYLKTDSGDNCADNNADAAWPPDLNNDRKVNQADSDLFKGKLNKKVNNFLLQRFDLNKDGIVTLQDVLMLNRYQGASCPFHFLAASTGAGTLVNGVSFGWKPALYAPHQLRVRDITTAAAGTCDLKSLLSTGTVVLGLTTGVSSYYWSLQSEIPGPIAGHKYCSAITYGEILTSPVVTFTVPTISSPPTTPTPTPVQISCTLQVPRELKVGSGLDGYIQYTPGGTATQFVVILYGPSGSVLATQDPLGNSQGIAQFRFPNDYFSAGTYKVVATTKTQQACQYSPTYVTVS